MSSTLKGTLIPTFSLGEKELALDCAWFLSFDDVLNSLSIREWAGMRVNGLTRTQP